MTRSPARGETAERPLHVGLNLYFLHDRAGGTGTYARELIRGLLAVEPQTRVTAFVTDQVPASLVETAWEGDVRWEVLPGKVVDGPPWNSATSVLSQWVLEPGRARARGVDVLHGLANVVPVVATVPTVVTMLDLIWMHYPGTMTPRDTLGVKVLGLTSARRADRIVAISQAGKDDLVQTLGLDPGRIDVTMLGIRDGGSAPATPEPELRRRLELGAGPIVLCVAQKRIHKNLDGLVRAFALLRGHDDAVLVLPGGSTPYEQEVRALAAGLGLQDRVRFLEWVSSEDLEGLFAAASAFVLASLMEGFGLPIVEAMQHGVPVACSGTTSLPEVAGDAALYFDPTDDAAIAAAIARLLEDRPFAAELARRGRERCAELTWESTAAATLAVYRRAIAERGR